MTQGSFSVRYEIWAYPFNSFYPQSGEAYSTPEEIYGDPVEVENARGLNFTRSKNSVNDSASFDIYGPLDKSCFKGSWVVIYSFGGDHDLEDKRVIQFFGQIEKLNISYSADGRGKVSQNSQVIVRSWAYLLKCFVKLDQFALYQLSSKGETAPTTFFQELSKKTDTDFLKFASSTFSPFGFGKAVLSLIGAMQQESNAKDESYIDYFKMKLPTVALSLPSIPFEICKNLIYNQGVEYNNPLSTGFMEYAAGVNTSPDNYIKDYESAVFLYPANTWQDFQDAYDEDIDRPRISDVAVIFMSGDSAWDMLTKHTDHASCEVFADFFVTLNDSGEALIQPYIIVRDKPYATKYQISNLDRLLSSKWSTFDDLITMEIPPDSIIGISISDSFASSPNFIRIQYNNSSMISEAEITRSAFDSTRRQADEMSRYGGQAMYLDSPYITYDMEEPALANPSAKDVKKKDPTATVTDYAKDLSAMNYCWYGQSYMYPDATLTLIDNNFIFNVGINLRFSIGGNTFVGHIESFSKSYSVSSVGGHSTRTTVQLSKLCLRQTTGDLLPIPPKLILDLYSGQVPSIFFTTSDTEDATKNLAKNFSLA